MATSTHHSRNYSVASSIRHKRPITSQDPTYLFKLLIALDSDDSYDNKFEGQLDLDDSF